MSSICQIGSLSALQAKCSAVFLHGLDGDIRDTWSAGPDVFWPKWLADEIVDLAVYSVGYEASASAWFGTAMPLQDRATNVLALLDNENIAHHPIIFICHSLGGLVVKQMLRNANDFGDEQWIRIREQTKAIFFLATPHTGAHVATFVGALGRLLLRPSDAIGDLQANTGPLRNLNLWYRNNAPRFRIETRIFYETQSTRGINIVDAGSADLGLQGVTPIPVDADHLSICKPRSRDDLVYKSIKRAIEHLLAGPRMFGLQLQELLTAQVDECRRRDVKFRSTHVVLALLIVPTSFSRACCDRVERGFAEDFIARLERFVTRQGETPEERGFVPVELAEHPLVVIALDNARHDQRSVADERDLFLAFLRSNSGTNTWAKSRLGAAKFSQLLTETERQSVAGINLGGTDPRLLE